MTDEKQDKPKAPDLNNSHTIIGASPAQIAIVRHIEKWYSFRNKAVQNEPLSANE